MTAVDPVFAQWLQAECLWDVASAPAVEAAWGAVAQLSSRETTLADQVDAHAEAVRQLAFLGFPMAIDEHQLEGVWGPYLGLVITITGSQLGYDAGVPVFVIRAEDERSTGLSRVTVIRRLDV